MLVTRTELPEVLLITPRFFSDSRGDFHETYHATRYREAGVDAEFMQENQSRSQRGALRGLHFQHPHAQAKLVRVAYGAVFDVAVDVRVGSPTFGRWVSHVLDAASGVQLFIPRGFAHGYQSLKEGSVFSYSCDAGYAPEHERVIRFDDPALGIQWPLAEAFVSERDCAGLSLGDALARGLLPSFPT